MVPTDACSGSDRLPIVAVHGNGGGRTRFGLVPPLEPPGRLHAIDLPGFGGTEPNPALVSVADYADHLATELATQPTTPNGPPLVLGHGIGGSIALDLAARRPETMAGLILHAPVGVDLDRRLLPRLLSTPFAREAARRLIASRAARPVLSRLFFDRTAPPGAVDAFFDGYRTCRVFGDMFELITADWFERLPPVDRVPTVLLWGSNDRLLAADHVQSFRSKIPGATVRIVDGWNHFPMIDDPEGYGRVISDLVASLADRPADPSTDPTLDGPIDAPSDADRDGDTRPR